MARVKVLRTPDSWFGVTYGKNRPLVVGGIRKLIARGDYPEKLRLAWEHFPALSVE
jgi:hypothetical protein